MVDTLARQRSIVGTTAEWNANDLILGAGEMALERTTTGEVKAKVGDGAKRFSQSPYLTIDQEQAIALFDDSLRLDTRALLYGPAGNQTIGRAGAVTVGAANDALATYGFLSPALVDSNITGVRAYLAAGATSFKVKIFEQIAGIWTQVGANVSLTAVPGANSWSFAGNSMPAIPIKAGQIVGFYGGGVAVSYDPTPPTDSFITASPGDQTTLGGAVSQVQFKVGFDLVPATGSAGIQTIGRNVANMPNAANHPGSNNTLAFIDPARNPSQITAIRAYLSGTPTALAIKIFKQTASTSWTQTEADVSLPAAAGLNQWSVAGNTMPPIFVPEGAFIGWFGVGGSITLHTSEMPRDLFGYYTSTGNQKTLSLVDGASYRIQLGFDLTPVAGVALQREPIEDAIDATERLKSPAIQTLGITAFPSAGTAMPDATYFIGPCPFDGVISTADFYNSSVTPRDLLIQSFRLDRGLMIPRGGIATVNARSGWSQDMAVNLPINAGDYIGAYNGTGSTLAATGVAGKNPFYSAPGNCTGAAYPAAVALNNDANQIQYGFDINYREFRGLKYQTIGQAAYNALGTYDPNTLYVIQGALVRDEDRPAIEELPAGELPAIGETLPELPEAEQ